MTKPVQERSSDCGTQWVPGIAECGLTKSIRNSKSGSRHARLRRIIFCTWAWIFAGIAISAPQTSAQTPLQDLFNRVQQRNAQIEEQQSASSGPTAANTPTPTNVVNNN